jgi:ABC-type glycerol-3-phosphate transport system substrate-binding protein
MGATFDYNWGSINQAFAAGQIGMFTGGSDLYTAMVQNNNLNPADYGVTIIPLASDPNAASSAAAPSRPSTSSPPKTSATRRSTGSTSTT